jgi:hypothetical protein
MLLPDILATVRFLSTDEGGRHGPITAPHLGMIMEYGGELWESRLLLHDLGTISPGETAIIPIKFLSPELVKPLLRAGDHFRLREARWIAEGVIDKIYDRAT